ncbi:unnamed protein product, partial [marine sediment metagenome]
MKKLSEYEKLLHGSYTEFELDEDSYLIPAPVAAAADAYYTAVEV